MTKTLETEISINGQCLDNSSVLNHFYKYHHFLYHMCTHFCFSYAHHMVELFLQRIVLNFIKKLNILMEN